MNKLYGGVCFAAIDIDSELKYPKGAGRVSFSNQQSYVNAISSRFVQLKYNEIDKRVMIQYFFFLMLHKCLNIFFFHFKAEIKPYVLDDQMCDLCNGFKCAGKCAQFFCANITCLQYYCEHCWSIYHSKPGLDFHKPLVKEGNDRPKTIPFRWC
jgi:cytoplasmic polyadenylation element-binding protein